MPGASTVALAGCRIDRALDGRVEVVEAVPANRCFPARVTQSLGVCLKAGPAHPATADGRALVYPGDALCIRPPGCIWATEATGPVGFLSIDLDPALLPTGLLRGSMTFATPSAIPDLRSLTRLARGLGGPRQLEEEVAELILALDHAGLVRAEELRQSASRRISLRVREAIESAIANPPSVGRLSQDLGVSRFALLRRFKRDFGVTPHAFLVRLRVDLARDRLARGSEIGEVAQTLGFADQAHFSRFFKRIVGVTPGTYARCVRTAAAAVPAHFRSRREGRPP